ncbi:hypothetical protein BMS3Bbin16_00827 [archaeon BMS3Bbin16]|nr:hypothetical protein BMS3Bbin16_00827 [archaeon BMS3Bbin16]
MSSITGFINRVAGEILFLNNAFFILILAVLAVAFYFYTRDWRR